MGGTSLKSCINASTWVMSACWVEAVVGETELSVVCLVAQLSVLG